MGFLGPREHDGIVADGRESLLGARRYRSKRREVRRAIERDYEPELAAAGHFRRAVVRVRMWWKIRRETDALAPERGLYLRYNGDPRRR